LLGKFAARLKLENVKVRPCAPMVDSNNTVSIITVAAPSIITVIISIITVMISIITAEAQEVIR
jgi:heme/copper-type cytochrome/quinol oxidase subunit 2